MHDYLSFLFAKKNGKKSFNLITFYIFVALQRNDAAGWLRKTVGVVLGKDLPAEPSEEEFRLGLRSGKILCTVLNKIKPGSVPKVCMVISPNFFLIIFHLFD